MAKEHPDRFADLEHCENAVRLEISRLIRHYGQAASRRY